HTPGPYAAPARRRGPGPAAGGDRAENGARGIALASVLLVVLTGTRGLSGVLSGAELVDRRAASTVGVTAHRYDGPGPADAFPPRAARRRHPCSPWRTTVVDSLTAQIIVTVLAGIAYIVGLTGIVVPVLPGTVTIVLAALVWAIVIG